MVNHQQLSDDILKLWDHLMIFLAIADAVTPS